MVPPEAEVTYFRDTLPSDSDPFKRMYIFDVEEYLSSLARTFTLIVSPSPTRTCIGVKPSPPSG